MQNLMAAAGVLLGALLITGCATQDPAASPAPRPTSTPVFASDEEALAAAEAAYAEYLKVSDAIAADGGAGVDRLEPLVTAEWYEKELVAFKNLRETGRHQEGTTSYSNVQLQQVEPDGTGGTLLTIYACSDSSGTSFVNSDGTDGTPEKREVSVGVEVIFITTYSTQPQLRLSNYSPWPDDSLC